MLAIPLLLNLRNSIRNKCYYNRFHHSTIPRLADIVGHFYGGINNHLMSKQELDSSFTTLCWISAVTAFVDCIVSIWPLTSWPKIPKIVIKARTLIEITQRDLFLLELLRQRLQSKQRTVKWLSLHKHWYLVGLALYPPKQWIHEPRGCNRIKQLLT